MTVSAHSLYAVLKVAVATGVVFFPLAGLVRAEQKPAQTPPTVSSVSDANDLATKQGEKMQREQAARYRRWDAEMSKMMKSICRGC